MNKQSIGEMLRKIDARPDELAEYKGKWRRLHFYTTGSHFGNKVYETKEQALNGPVWDQPSDIVPLCRGLDGSTHMKSNYLFFIPMPAGNP